MEDFFGVSLSPINVHKDKFNRTVFSQELSERAEDYVVFFFSFFPQCTGSTNVAWINYKKRFFFSKNKSAQ